MFPVSVSAALAAIPLALFVVRILSPALVFLSTLSLVASRPPSVLQSPSSITSVVVATRVPRRALILAFLSLTGLTYLSDGLTFVVYAVLHKTWPHHTGIEINAVIGLAAFSGLAALGALKDVQGVEVWSFKRVKAVIASALIFDLSIVGLLVASLYLSTHCKSDLLVSGFDLVSILSSAPTMDMANRKSPSYCFPGIPYSPPVAFISGTLVSTRGIHACSFK